MHRLWGFYGGIVAPALFVGAATGALLAKVLLLGFDYHPVAAECNGRCNGCRDRRTVNATLLIVELTGAGINGALVVVTAYASTWLTRKYLTPSYYQAQLNEILVSAKT